MTAKSNAREGDGVGVLRRVLQWASSRCPADEAIDPCTLCGATVKDGTCKAVESIFPADLLRDMQAAMQAQQGAEPVAWQPIETAPKDGTYLVANALGQVAPWINGVIHNNVGTANDWHYGEAATAWQPLPTAPESKWLEIPACLRRDDGAPR